MSPRRLELLPARGRPVVLTVVMAALSALVPRVLAAPLAQSRPPANRLAHETSPYLLLHAHNPVDWFPWGPEAFAKARAEGKPIFLSVGYSSCYWCHVMERECFNDPAIARLLNEQFISIKVDREERPDVDMVYMAGLQVFGPGGWPMSMFLTPDGRPFFGGTYYPPEDREGMEGFPSVLKRVVEAWRDHRTDVERDADRLTNLVKRTLASTSALRKAPLSRQFAAEGRAALAEQFDPEFGGFGFNPENARRPKFPEPVNLVFLLDQYRRDKAAGSGARASNPAPLEMVVTTLDRMARGGIRDQLAGGYHRYATSRYWIVPHFEKMLYDNAQLASVHLLALELTGDLRWKTEAEATFAFLDRTLTAPEGGFASSLDAETQGEEGAYYVWSRAEVRQVLGEGPDADAFAQVYGLSRSPNFVKDRYVLLEPGTRSEQAAALATTPEALESRLAPLRQKLLAARDARPAPRRDDKVLTAWNGLTVAAYADGFRLLHDPRFRATAEKTAEFLWSTLRTRDGRLLRSFRAGQAKIPAYLDDYAFLAHGLLRLHAATGDARWLTRARTLADRMIVDFVDARNGGFFYTAGDHESLIARPKDPVDGALPSGNSVAVRALIALAAATHDSHYLDVAGKALEACAGSLSQAPGSSPLMLVALGEYLDARPEAARPADEPAALGPAGQRSKEVVTATAIAKPPTGERLDVVVTLHIQPGWHVYANPTGVAGIAPTRLTLDLDSGWTIDRVAYPAGVARVLESSGSRKVALYEGKVDIPVQLKPGGPGRPPGGSSLRFTVAYQACNDRYCLAPVKQPLTVPLPRRP